MTQEKKDLPIRPLEVKGITRCIKTGCGKAYITVSTDPNYPYEVFGLLGKTGGCAAAQMTSITRLITKARLYGMPVEEIIRQLKGTQCPSSSDFQPSCPEAIARALEELAINDPINQQKEEEQPQGSTKAPGGAGAGEESTG